MFPDVDFIKREYLMVNACKDSHDPICFTLATYSRFNQWNAKEGTRASRESYSKIQLYYWFILVIPSKSNMYIFTFKFQKEKC